MAVGHSEQSPDEADWLAGLDFGDLASLGAGWTRLARGAQHDLWSDPAKCWVLKVARPGWRHALARLPGERVAEAEWAARLGNLLLPQRWIDQPEWEDAHGQRHRAGRGRLLPRLPASAFLADGLWRRPDPQAAADGVEQLLAILRELSRRGLVMLDFISDNFAWFEGRLRISDPDLVVSARRARWSAHCRPVWEGFRRGLGRDYARLLALRADEAQQSGDLALARRLRGLAGELEGLLPGLLAAACRAEREVRGG